MKLSEHFTLAEFTRNSRGIPNDPPPSVIPCLEWFCKFFLEPIRSRFGPLRITSGYRGPALNALVGGAQTSAHKADARRCAADIQPVDPSVKLEDIFDWIRLDSKLPVDQVILERGKMERHEYDDCIHIGVRKDDPRMMALEGATHGASGYEAREYIA